MTPENNRSAHLLIAGAVHVDDVARPTAPLVSRASNPVCWQQYAGGVGANVAFAAQRAGLQNCFVELVAAVGDDPMATKLEYATATTGIKTRFIQVPEQPTGRYCAIMNHHGELYIGLADVALAEQLTGDHILLTKSTAQTLVLDANLSASCVETVCTLATNREIKVCALSVSPYKTRRLSKVAASIDVLFCNPLEAASLIGIDSTGRTDTEYKSLDKLADALLNLGFRQFVLTNGSNPLLVQETQIRQHIDVPPVTATYSVNGAGDALAGATLAAWSTGVSLSDAVHQYGLIEAAAVVTGKQLPLRL